ncbi:MAG: glycosyltransferase [Deltaproteobacteria bacterium]|nr:glycosyltransferase [Deltaproteobacteria bacterium]
MRLSVIIPVHDERPTIEQILERVRAVPIDKEILVIDDGSRDGTREYLQARPPQPDLRVFFQPENRGKGAAVRRGLDEARGEVVVIQDADLEYDPQDYRKLIEPIDQGLADVVYGSRFLGWPRRVLRFRHQLANRFLTTLSNLATDLNLSDMETCYKMMTRDVAKTLRLRSDRFGIEPEITAQIARLGYRVYEVPISYHGRDYWEGKKIRWTDGIAAVWTILRCAFAADEHDEDAGYRILQRMQKVSRYNRWMWQQLEHFVGNRVLEVGSGVGNMTRFLLRRERVVATDLNERYLRILRQLFGSYPHVTIDRFDLNDGRPPPGAERVDTVLCLNVLEHVEHDDRALASLHDLLEPGGRLVLLVPALRALYGSLDRALEHRRRYRRAELLDKLRAAGFEIEDSWFFNLLGVAGWYLNSRLLRRTTFPPLQLALYDRLVPLLRVESRFRLPVGMSLIAIGRKPRRR